MSEGISAEELLVRVDRQEVAALSELYDRYAPRVLGLLAYALPPHDNAEKVLREVFQQLWSESRNLVQEGASVAAWLVLTAREAALARFHDAGPSMPRYTYPSEATRAENREPSNIRSTDGGISPSLARKTAPHAIDAGSGTRKHAAVSPAKVKARRKLPPAWVPRPEAVGLIDERLGILHKVINQLPKTQRQALDLMVFCGFGELEIAAQMGEPLGKARTRLRAAITFVKHRRRAILGTWAANI